MQAHGDHDLHPGEDADGLGGGEGLGEDVVGAVIFWATCWAAAMSSRGSMGKKTGVRPYVS
ncbi:MAG: hypothetical protein ACLUNZ_11225 [Evtepia sp.]